jgi:hypothetical protein
MNKLLVFFVLFSGSAFASGGNINVIDLTNHWVGFAAL